jgi:hypothetical protein
MDRPARPTSPASRLTSPSLLLCLPSCHYPVPPPHPCPATKSGRISSDALRNAPTPPPGLEAGHQAGKRDFQRRKQIGARDRSPRSHPPHPQPGLRDERDLSVVARLGCGGVAGTLGQTVAYPFDVARRRLQVGPPAQPLTLTHRERKP